MTQTSAQPQRIYRLIDRRIAQIAEPPRIDYERMKREYPRYTRKLDQLVKTGDAVAVAKLCKEVVDFWTEIGSWPDDWSRWQRALDDVLPWPLQADFTDVATGQVEVIEIQEDQW